MSDQQRSAADVFASMAMVCSREMNPSPSTYEEPKRADEVRVWSNVLARALTSRKFKHVIPTLHVFTCLHASLRWNKGQRFKANDFNDFAHACSALAYCDVFLTERALKSMVTAKHVALDRVYECEVASEVPEAVQVVDSKH